MPSQVWDEITYPYPNFNGANVEFWGVISKLISHFVTDVITFPCWIKKQMFSKRGPRSQRVRQLTTLDEIVVILE